MIVYMMFISTFINISYKPYTYTSYMYVAIQRKEKKTITKIFNACKNEEKVSISITKLESDH